MPCAFFMYLSMLTGPRTLARQLSEADEVLHIGSTTPVFPDFLAIVSMHSREQAT